MLLRLGKGKLALCPAAEKVHSKLLYLWVFVARQVLVLRQAENAFYAPARTQKARLAAGTCRLFVGAVVTHAPKL